MGSTVYDEFLLGVESAGWLAPAVGRLRAHRGRALGASGKEAVDLLAKASAGKAAPATPVAAVAAEAAMSPARIAGLVFAGTLTATAVGGGTLIVAGVVGLATSVVTEPTFPAPPPPPPPNPPPAPDAPPGLYTMARGACSTQVAGLFVNLAGNGRCEDGGPGSVADSLCELGTDWPDCPIRFTDQPPSPTPPSLPPAPDSPSPIRPPDLPLLPPPSPHEPPPALPRRAAVQLAAARPAAAV